MNRLPPNRAREILRIAWSMTVACVLGAAVLGMVYLGTERYRAAAALRSEREAVAGMLGLDAGARVVEVRQFLDPSVDHVIYRAAPFGDDAAPRREVVFSVDGTRLGGRTLAAADDRTKGLTPLGRVFVASENGRLSGFVVEGVTRGYKASIRFFVGLTAGFEVCGVRVVESEEDPGLGAEVATPWFRNQYVGRSADEIDSLTVTRDPMPEDWHEALVALDHGGARARAVHAKLLERERKRPIYAVTGATISSRAMTNGLRATIDHFRRRWTLLAPDLGGAS